MVAVVYLIITLILSKLVGIMEERLGSYGKR
jgi:ABC-type amino acid transport system permease subunit